MVHPVKQVTTAFIFEYYTHPKCTSTRARAYTTIKTHEYLVPHTLHIIIIHVYNIYYNNMTKQQRLLHVAEVGYVLSFQIKYNTMF